MRVKLSSYGMALNTLNELPLKQHRIFEKALEELRVQAEEWKQKYESLEIQRASCCIEMEAVITEVKDLWPYLNCVCGRNQSRFPDKLRERMRAVLKKE